MSNPETGYVLNRAYQALVDRNVDDRMPWMRELRRLAQVHGANHKMAAQLRKERDLCLKTVKQLQESVETLRRVNRRYGSRIYDTDKAINAAMAHIEDGAPEDYEEAHAVLDRALCGFPSELVGTE
jgi:hypothetical protein